MKFFVFRTSNFLGFGIAIGLAISWIIYTIFGHSWAFPCWGFLPVFWLYCGRLPWSGYSQSLRDCMPLSWGFLYFGRGIRNRCALAHTPIREFAALPPGSGFVSRPRRGIRNRCAIACPLAEPANTFPVLFCRGLRPRLRCAAQPAYASKLATRLCRATSPLRGQNKTGQGAYLDRSRGGGI